MGSISFECIYCKKGKARLAKSEKLKMPGRNKKTIEIITDCHKCDNCGEIYFDAQESKKVAKLLDDADKPERVVVKT